MSEIEPRVRRVIMETLGVTEDQVKGSARIADDLGADSIDEVELVMAIEEEFRTEISDDEGAAVKTVDDAVALVARLMADG